jgi:hypothetical protein
MLGGDAVVAEHGEQPMAEPVRARRLTEDEGRRLLKYVRRGKQGARSGCAGR